MVQEYDNIGHPGLAYCSLITTTVGKDQSEESIIKYETETELDRGAMTEDTVIWPANRPVTLAITNRYFKCDNSALKIISLNATQVVFSLTPGVGSVNIQYKDENGELVNKLYMEATNDD